MGALLIDSSTKGFTGLTAVSASEAVTLDENKVSPALTKLLGALREVGNNKGPTEVVIGVFGRKHHVFSIQLENLSEIEEILQWTIGRE